MVLKIKDRRGDMRGWLTTTSQVVAILVALSPAVAWFLAKADAAGREYVRMVVSPELKELKAQTQTIQQQLEELVAKQRTEAEQSGEEADVNRQILCLLRAQNGVGSLEECASNIDRR